jgi:hypothetical protein
METSSINLPTENLSVTKVKKNSSFKRNLILINGLLFLVIIVVIGTLVFKSSSNKVEKNETVVLETKTIKELTPIPTTPSKLSSGNSDQSLETDLNTLDQQLGILTKDQTQIDAGINETLPNLTF